MTALVLIHGAFHRPAMWRLLVSHLHGVDVRTLQLPSSRPGPVDQLGDMYDDAQAVRDVALSVDGPIVAVAHSYGAVPASQGLYGLDAVKRLVLLNAFVLEPGAAMLDIRAGGYPPHWNVHEDEGYILMRDAERVFYNDLSPDAAREAAADLGPQSLAAMRQPLTRAAWQHLPTTYVVGELDQGHSPALRERFASRAQNVVRLQTSHSPFLSQPAEVAELLRKELALAATN